MTQTALAEKKVPGQKPRWPIIFAFALISVFAGYAAWYGIYLGYSFGNWMLFISLYHFTGLGITVGFHRLATHVGFKCHRVLAIILYIAGSMAAQKSIRGFVGTHRFHHKYADEPLDPHSPRRKWILGGPFWAHMGWLMFTHQYTKEEFDTMVRDVDRDVLMRVISRLSIPLILAGFIIPFFLFGWEGLLLSGFLRLFMVHHITFSVNSLCHMPMGFFTKKILGHFSSMRIDAKHLIPGLLYILISPLWLPLEFILLFGRQSKLFTADKRFTDDSRNNYLLVFLTFGEAMHNNHHYDPRYAYHGWKWYDIDLSKWFIKLLQIKTVGFTRLIWKVSKPRSKSSLAMTKSMPVNTSI